MSYLVATPAPSERRMRTLGVLALLIGSWGCPPPRSVPPKNEEPAPEAEQSDENPMESTGVGSKQGPGVHLGDMCERERRLSDTIGRLGLAALDVYGRIDPRLFVLEGNNAKVEVNPKVQRRANRHLADFDRSISKVRETPGALAKFRKMLAEVKSTCPVEICKEQSYDIIVERTDPLPPGNKGEARLFGEFYSWHIKGAGPSLDAWTKFLELYNYEVSSECPFAPPLYVVGLERALLDVTDKQFFGLTRHTTGSGGANFAICQENRAQCGACGESYSYHQTNSGFFCCGSLC